MKTTITSASFVEAFRDGEGNLIKFSEDGLKILFNYFERYEQDYGVEEQDVVAICCNFRESSIENIVQEYEIDVSEADQADEEDKLDIIQEIVLEYLNDHTSVVGVTSSGDVIYQNF